MITMHIQGAKELVDYYRDLAANQLPFILARGLTRTAQDAQAAVRRRQESVFILRHKSFVQGGVRIEPATKANPQAVVKDIDAFMNLQEFGGMKIPYKKHLAIPLKGARPTARSLVTMKPSEVMDHGGFIKWKDAAQTEGIMYAITLTRSRGGRLSRALGYGFVKGGTWTRSIMPMYALVKSASMSESPNPRYHFVDTVRQAANENFPRRFGESFQQVMGGK